MQRILVTGANKGIGLATVERILAEHEGTMVFLGARDRGRGEAAREGLLAEHPDWAARLEVVELDVSDDASVSAAAASLTERFAGEPAPLYAVVNNAGIGLGSTSMAQVLAVNTYGVRRVVEAFLPLLDPEAGRVVVVSSASGPMFVSGCDADRQAFFLSDAHDWQALDAFMQRCLADPSEAAFAALGMGSTSAYGLSKACVNTYVLMLARQHPKLAINACTPGYIATDLTVPPGTSQGRTPAQMGMKTPHQGATASLHLLFGALEGNGRYYGSDAVRSPMHAYRSPGDPPYTGD